MTKVFGFIGATLGSSLGWWIGQREGFMTAFLLSIVGTGFGLYFGRRAADQWLG